MTALCEPGPRGPGECNPTRACHQVLALLKDWRGTVFLSPCQGHGAYLLHKCPSTLSLQVQCPVLGSQVPTLPAGSQVQGLDGVR